MDSSVIVKKISLEKIVTQVSFIIIIISHGASSKFRKLKTMNLLDNVFEKETLKYVQKYSYIAQLKTNSLNNYFNSY